MLYQASSERLKPLVTESLAYSLKYLGTLESTHDLGSETLMPFLALSKSSIYEALSCVPPAVPAIRWANSPVKVICEGWVQCRKGSLSSMRVSHWLSFFQLMFRPHSVFFSGSEPMVTFDVRACSDRCCSVPPIWKSFEKSYSQLKPNIRLRCMPYSVFDSSDTLTFVPASMMLWFRMVTSPAE